LIGKMPVDQRSPTNGWWGSVDRSVGSKGN
jgi:hypothetical protein